MTIEYAERLDARPCTTRVVGPDSMREGADRGLPRRPRRGCSTTSARSPRTTAPRARARSGSADNKGHAALLAGVIDACTRPRRVRARPGCGVRRPERRARGARVDCVGRAGRRRARPRTRPGAGLAMCGICGLVAHSDGFASDEDIVVRDARRDGRTAAPTTPARGSAPSGRVALGHRRLSIVDLSPAGHQPMANEDGTVWITFNGEIYNHVDAAPRARGARAPVPLAHATRRRSSTSTRRRAPRCVERLARHVRVRDLGRTNRASSSWRATGSGIKPLYYAEPPGGFLFGSEIKALLAHPAVTRGPRRGRLLPLPDLRLHARAADDVRGHLASSRPAERMTVQRRRLDRARHVLERRCRRAVRRGARGDRARPSWSARLARAAARVDRQADDVRRPVRRLPLRRRRLVDERRADVASSIDEPVRTFSVGFGEHEQLQRARVRPPRRAALRHRPPRGR